MTSGIFGLVYLALLGRTLVDVIRDEGFVVHHPRAGALLALAGGIVIPASLALVPAPEWRWMEKVRAKLPEVARYDFTPTAWDKAFQSAENCFVRVLTRHDRRIAGFYGPRSYATSFPEPQQLFLERAFQISADGTIGSEIVGTMGVIVDCTAIQLLQVLSTTTTEGGPSDG